MRASAVRWLVPHWGPEWCTGCDVPSREPESILFARNLFLPDDLGGNRYPYETIRRLGARGHRITVATPRLHGSFPPLPNITYHTYRIARPHPAVSHFTNLVGATLAFRGLPRHDVALVGSYDAALALGWAGLVPRTPMLFLYHSEFYSEWVSARSAVRQVMRRYMAAVERRVFALSARIIAVSEFSATQIRSRLPGATERVRVLPTGVETDYFVPPADKSAVRRELGLPSDVPVALGVGRLARVKQFDRLITAFAVASARGLDARLVIAGGGPERPNLERLIATYGVQDRVLLAGYCDPPRLRAFMQAADLQVCSSTFENLSLAILEGMSCGTPVLGTPGGGTPELVSQIDSDLVLADDHAHTMADALPTWLRQPGRLAGLGARARRIAVERYDWERVVDGLEAVCSEVARP
jgi:glycosyltransferase involved in cell wall biosynthesis